MEISLVRTAFLLLFAKIASSEIIFKWPDLKERIGDDVCQFKATSFEYANHKFYLTLVDLEKKTPGVGYVAWFLPGEEISPKLIIHGNKDDYKLFHMNGRINTPMLIREDPCGGLWVVDANMHDIAGEQVKEAPLIHLYESVNSKRIIRDNQWKENSVFMNIAFEEREKPHNETSRNRCNPMNVYLADADNFNIFIHHHNVRGTTRKIYHSTRASSSFEELPNKYRPLLHDSQIGGVMGLTLVKTEKFGLLLMYHVLGGTTENIIPLEDRKNESALHAKDVRIIIEKGPYSEAGRTAYDPATGTVFFAELRSRKIGFLNLHSALQWNIIEPIYKRYDTKLVKGLITDMKVIGKALWVLTSSDSGIMLEKEIISEMIHEHKSTSTFPNTNAVCEMLECPLPSHSNEVNISSYLLLLSFFFLIF